MGADVVTEDLPIIYDILKKRLEQGDHIRLASVDMTFGWIQTIDLSADGYVDVIYVGPGGTLQRSSSRPEQLESWKLKRNVKTWTLTVPL
jgi:hypothetical protein